MAHVNTVLQISFRSVSKSPEDFLASQVEVSSKVLHSLSEASHAGNMLGFFYVIYVIARLIKAHNI